MNSLCVVSYVADEDAYTGGENVVEVQEESFGEHYHYCVNQKHACHCCCHHPVHLLIEEGGETLEVIDVQNESFGE